MLDYRIEALDDRLRAEMEHMASLYWQDVAAPFHDFPPDADWALYEGLQGAGRLRVVAGRDARGRLKAFGVIVIGPHPHYACVYGTVPLVFLHPDFRKGPEGMRLVRICERAAEGAGAQLLMTHGGMHNGVYRLFEGMHYADFGKYYVKVLKNGPNGTSPVYKKDGTGPVRKTNPGTSKSGNEER